MLAALALLECRAIREEVLPRQRELSLELLLADQADASALARAEALGLTYEEYTMELLERGRYLQPEDVERIAAIKAMRRGRRRRR